MTKEARLYNGEKTVSSVSGARKLDSSMWKNEMIIFFNKIYKQLMCLYIKNKQSNPKNEQKT